MELIAYPLLRGDSVRAINKRQDRRYEPNGVLLKRLSVELGLSMADVRNQLMKERQYILDNKLLP